MKNKTIYIGKTGSGKSWKALKKIVRNKGTTVIVNGCVEKRMYEDMFPELKAFEEKDGRYNFSIEKNGKYFISGNFPPKEITSSVDFVKSLIQGCAYGTMQNDKNAMILFDDGSWERMPDKLHTLWQLSHFKCGISITLYSIEDLLDLRNLYFDAQMLKDIKRHWNIVSCSRSDWAKEQNSRM